MNHRQRWVQMNHRQIGPDGPQTWRAPDEPQTGRRPDEPQTWRSLEEPQTGRGPEEPQTGRGLEESQTSRTRTSIQDLVHFSLVKFKVQRSASTSLHSKAACLLNGGQQLVTQLVIVLVWREVYTIEAGVGLGEVVGAGINLMDGEESWTCSSLQSLEPLQRDPGGASHKLQQASPLLLIVRLHGPPEPAHDVAVC